MKWGGTAFQTASRSRTPHTQLEERHCNSDRDPTIQGRYLMPRADESPECRKSTGRRALQTNNTVLRRAPSNPTDKQHASKVNIPKIGACNCLRGACLQSGNMGRKGNRMEIGACNCLRAHHTWSPPSGCTENVDEHDEPFYQQLWRHNLPDPGATRLP